MLIHANAVLRLCERFGCLPEEGALYDQDAGLLRLLRIAEMGNPDPPEGGE